MLELKTLETTKMDSINTVTQIDGDPQQERSDDVQSTSSSQIVCGGCRKKLQRLLPVRYKEEIVKQVKLAGPVVSVNIILFECNYLHL